jgi:hypothetical protein
MRPSDEVTRGLSDPRTPPGDHRSADEWDDDELARYVELC